MSCSLGLEKCQFEHFDMQILNWHNNSNNSDNDNDNDNNNDDDDI